MTDSLAEGSGQRGGFAHIGHLKAGDQTAVADRRERPENDRQQDYHAGILRNAAYPVFDSGEVTLVEAVLHSGARVSRPLTAASGTVRQDTQYPEPFILPGNFPCAFENVCDIHLFSFHERRSCIG